MKTITLNRTGYYVRGVAVVKTWGCGKGYIEMKPFTVKKLSEIKDNVNDDGFGVEAIIGSICEIYDDFNGYHVHKKQIIIGTVIDKDIDYYYENYYENYE